MRWRESKGDESKNDLKEWDPTGEEERASMRPSLWSGFLLLGGLIIQSPHKLAFHHDCGAGQTLVTGLNSGLSSSALYVIMNENSHTSKAFSLKCL